MNLDIFEQNEVDSESNKKDLSNNEINNSKSDEKTLVEKNCLNNEIYVDIARSVTSHGYCLICKKSNNYQKLKQISKEAIIEAFCQTRILIPFGSRACPTHFDSLFKLKLEDLNEIKIYRTNTKLNSQQIEDLLLGFRSYAKISSLFKRFSNLNTITDDMCIRNTNLNKKQFVEMASYISTNSPIRSKTQALVIYLFWLKTGLDQRMVATHFELDSQFDISRILSQVRSGLSDFVKDNLGAAHLTRDQWLENNSKIAQELFCLRKSQFILMADGTYCKVERSSNNRFQRKT